MIFEHTDNDGDTIQISEVEGLTLISIRETTGTLGQVNLDDAAMVRLHTALLRWFNAPHMAWMAEALASDRESRASGKESESDYSEDGRRVAALKVARELTGPTRAEKLIMVAEWIVGRPASDADPETVAEEIKTLLGGADRPKP